jgi:ABC-type dipeptide/oligopeptide/nickel transport system permease subunit
VKGKSRTWILVKVVLTDPEQTYSLAKMQNPPYETAVYNGTTFNWPNSGWLSTAVSPWVVSRKTEFLDVPVGVKVFLGPADWPIEKMQPLFPTFGASPTGFTVNAATQTLRIIKPLSGNAYDYHWILSRPSKSNFVSLIQIELPYMNNRTFPMNPGRYRLVVQITFMDNTSTSQSVSSTVHVDDIALKLLGSSYGLLGTDQYGKDLFAQLIYGTRISLYIGITVAVMSVAIGVAVGLVSGYVGGTVDQALMRFNDLLLVLPGLPLLIVLVAVLGANIENLILLLGLLGWNGFARVVRSQVLSLKERPFIEAAKAAGAGTGHIIVRHVLPNVMALVYVSLATSVPGAITAEAALAFLGFYDPNRMSWGRMLHEVFAAGATRSWWWILPPGICIALIATAFILLGYALDEILNPKLRMRR